RLAASCGGREGRPLPDDAWPRLETAARAAFPAATAFMAFSVLPSQVADLMEQGAGAARAPRRASGGAAPAGGGGVARALGAGVGRGARASDVRSKEPAATAGMLTDWRNLARAGGGHGTLEWAPLAVKSQVPVWDDPGAAGRIMERIKAQLDPRNILNPGRFVAGI